MANAEKIKKVLEDKFNDAKFVGDYKTIEITFKATGNKWEIQYMLHWGGTRYGFSGNYYKATNNGTVKYFKSIESLSRAIAAGYIA